MGENFPLECSSKFVCDCAAEQIDKGKATTEFGTGGVAERSIGRAQCCRLVRAVARKEKETWGSSNVACLEVK